MFDIGFQELLLISVLALLVMGPERLPGAIRTASLWLAKLRRGFQDIKSEIEREVGADDIRQQLHNESILKSLQQSQQQLQQGVESELDKLKAGADKLEYDIADIVKGDTALDEQTLGNSDSSKDSTNT